MCADRSTQDSALYLRKYNRFPSCMFSPHGVYDSQQTSIYLPYLYWFNDKSYSITMGMTVGDQLLQPPYKHENKTLIEFLPYGLSRGFRTSEWKSVSDVPGVDRSLIARNHCCWSCVWASSALFIRRSTLSTSCCTRISTLRIHAVVLLSLICKQQK